MRTLTPWRAGDNFLDQLRPEMDDMFQRFFGLPVEAKSNGETTLWAPRVDPRPAFVVKSRFQ